MPEPLCICNYSTQLLEIRCWTAMFYWILNISILQNLKDFNKKKCLQDQLLWVCFISSTLGMLNLGQVDHYSRVVWIILNFRMPRATNALKKNVIKGYIYSDRLYPPLLKTAAHTEHLMQLSWYIKEWVVLGNTNFF